MNFFNLTYLLVLSIFSDFLANKSIKSMRINLISIILFRFNQYIGTYEGLNLKNDEIDKLKSTFYYPPKRKKNYSNKSKKIKNKKNNQNLNNYINYDAF